jgi:ornithine lipid ester-linked acyl 2-hydroxylase
MIASITIAAESALDIASALRQMPGSGKRGKGRVKDAINRVYSRCERAGLLARLPAFDEQYADYPELRIFETHYADVRAECEALLEQRDQLTDVAALGGDYTSGGIHTIRWKALMLKAGGFVEPNCALAPKTAELLRKTPSVRNAFFSILEPRQYVTPHWGYYKGFARYHLGVVIPGDNATGACWLRVNPDVDDHTQKDLSQVERGKKYYWRNGRGMIFDDTNLHDACNDSDEVRVVLWLDVVRKLPWPLSLYNELLLSAIYLEPSIRKFRESGVVRLKPRAQRHQTHDPRPEERGSLPQYSANESSG